MIFEQDPPYMLNIAMEALIDIVGCYNSLFGTFILMYNTEKPSHVLLKFATEKLIMKEVSFHISAELLGRLHQKKKAP